jgi:hypothetical protein
MKESAVSFRHRFAICFAGISGNTVREKNATADRGAPSTLTGKHPADYSSSRLVFSSMIPAKQLLSEIVNSIREVIAPAVAEPYPKAQAYMAAVILEFVARQIEERGDLERRKHAAMLELVRDLSPLPEMSRLLRADHLSEAGLCELIEHLYAERAVLGEETFGAANRRVRQTLRELLDQDLKIAGKAEG